MTFIGDASTRAVYWADHHGAVQLLPFKSQKLRNHSPDGFNWGYEGSGPSQLALALLLECCTQRESLALYQLFKRDIIAKLEQDSDWELPYTEIYAFISKHLPLKDENLASTA